MKIKYGKGTSEYGPGVNVILSGSEVASAIDTYLVAHHIFVSGPRTVTVNGELCRKGKVHVDPSGFVVYQGRKVSGRGDDELKDGVFSHTELEDKIEGLQADLDDVVAVAYNRGAIDYVRLNYPKHYAKLARQTVDADTDSQ